MSVIKWIHFPDLHFNKTNINTRLLRDSIKFHFDRESDQV